MLPLNRQAQDCFVVRYAPLPGSTAEHNSERSLYLGVKIIIFSNYFFLAGDEKEHVCPLLQHHGNSQQPQQGPEPRNRPVAVFSRQKPAHLLETQRFLLDEDLGCNMKVHRNRRNDPPEPCLTWMLIAHAPERVDSSLHPPAYLKEDIPEVCQDFLVPRTKYIWLSPFQLA